MHAKRGWTLAAVVGAGALGGLAAACGSGHAIFNIDVYSFVKGTGKDTVFYAVPVGPPLSVPGVVQKLNLVGAGGSLVDSVAVQGTAKVENQTGTGTIAFQFFIAADSASTYTVPAAFSVSPATVANVDTVPITITGTLSPATDSLFTKSVLWVRLGATGTNTGATPVTGHVVLTSLLLTVVMNPKLL